MAIDTPAQPMIGEQAPLFTLKGIDGRTHHLADYRAELVVIHFGASW